MPSTAIPAAQYLRMSTDLQQYSIQNQAAAIQRYAELHNYKVVQTYLDPGKSGLFVKHRCALKQLLRDILSGDNSFRAVLVYDVSRWGRFQDTDEAAHYEFICKQAGAPVVYCAETFENDGSMPNMIMKSLKRIMASEYSRELSQKTSEGKARLSALGFRSGGIPGHGLRRMLVSANGTRRLLADGEQKALVTDHVILVPGPPDEVACIRRMFQLALEGVPSRKIARRLNCEGYTCSGRPWKEWCILNILHNPKYAGYNAWGRTSGRLVPKRYRAARRQWTVAAGAFEPLVSPEMFEAVQRKLHERPRFRSNEELLERLRGLLKKAGRLSPRIIETTAGIPTFNTLVHRFGSLKNVYELLGYRPTPGNREIRAKVNKLRTDLLKDILRTFPGQVKLMKRLPPGSDYLNFPGSGLTLSVLASASVPNRGGGLRWCLHMENERPNIVLLARCNSANDGFQDFWVMPPMQPAGRYRLTEEDAWLLQGQRIGKLSQLHVAVRAMYCSRQKKRT